MHARISIPSSIRMCFLYRRECPPTFLHPVHVRCIIVELPWFHLFSSGHHSSSPPPPFPAPPPPSYPPYPSSASIHHLERPRTTTQMIPSMALLTTAD